MINDLLQFLNYENIYLIANIGVIPCWLLLIFLPRAIFTKILVKSVIIPALLSTAYIFIAYQIYMTENIFEIFNLYRGLDELYSLYSNEGFLLIFWLHFIALNLFLGSWVSLDGSKYNIPRSVVFFPLVTIYFTGPAGLVLYWIIRIFYAKKIGFHD